MTKRNMNILSVAICDLQFITLLYILCNNAFYSLITLTKKNMKKEHEEEQEQRGGPKNLFKRYPPKYR
jgi:hypothetical protein